MARPIPGAGQAGRGQKGERQRHADHAQHPAGHVGQAAARFAERLQRGFVAKQAVANLGVGDFRQ